MDQVHGFTVDRGQGIYPNLIRVVGFVICGRTHATGSGARPARGSAWRRLCRKFAGDGGLGTTVHYLRRGLDREQEENVAELTRDSSTAVAQRRRRAAKRGGRDHGCPPGRGLRPRLRASAHWDEPLVYLCVRG
jgi:hypothetical protein